MNQGELYLVKERNELKARVAHLTAKVEKYERRQGEIERLENARILDRIRLDDLTESAANFEMAWHSEKQLAERLKERVRYKQLELDQAFSDQDGWSSKCRMVESELAAVKELARKLEAENASLAGVPEKDSTDTVAVLRNAVFEAIQHLNDCNYGLLRAVLHAAWNGTF